VYLHKYNDKIYIQEKVRVIALNMYKNIASFVVVGGGGRIFNAIN
jgi:hypothetical protein